MNPKIALLVSLLFILNGCSVLDRFQNKVDQKYEKSAAKPTPPAAKPAPAVQKVTPQYVSLEEYEQLKQAYQAQQNQIQKLREEQIKDRATISQLERKLITNFELLEQSVADSLKGSEQKLGQVSSQLKTLKAQTARQAKSTTASQAVSTDKSPATASRVPKKKAINGVAPAEPTGNKPLIETLSLFSKTSPQAPTKSTPPSVEKAPQSPKRTPVAPPKPIPIPANMVDETKPTSQKQSVVSETQPMAAAAAPSDEPYKDPDLNEPSDPYILESHPPVKKLYDQGMKAMINREHKNAIQTFADMLKQYPNDEYSDNALFWMGHLNFSLNRLDQAEDNFRQVLRQYEHRPTSQGYKTPDAIYMLGKIFESRKEAEKAEYYYQAVIQRFPGSTAANNAQDDLKVLNRL